jgi:hypothetical protein
MTEPLRISVEFAASVKRQLGDPPDLSAIVADAGLDGTTEWSDLPTTDPGVRTKSLVETVVLATQGAVAAAAAVKLLESALTHYLDHRAVRNSHFEYWVNEPLHDERGRVVLDKKGKPRLIRRRIGGFDALPAIPSEGITVSVGGSKGVSLQTGQSPTSAGGND